MDYLMYVFIAAAVIAIFWIVYRYYGHSKR